MEIKLSKQQSVTIILFTTVFLAGVTFVVANDDSLYLPTKLSLSLIPILAILLGVYIGISLTNSFVFVAQDDSLRPESKPTATRKRTPLSQAENVHEIDLNSGEDTSAAALRYARQLEFSVYEDADGIFINVDGELQPIRFIESEESDSFEYE